MAKFRKFQRPVDFEPKLTHVKRILDEIEERMHLIEIRTDDPETLQNQLETCMVSAACPSPREMALLSALQAYVDFCLRPTPQNTKCCIR